MLWTGLALGGEPAMTARSSADWVVFEILWPEDTDDAVGQTRDGRALGDNSSIHFDFDGDGARSPHDKSALINMWPAHQGLYVDDIFESGGSKARRVSGGRAAVTYSEAGRRDICVIPREEFPTSEFQAWFYIESPSDGLKYKSPPAQVVLDGAVTIDPQTIENAETSKTEILAVGETAKPLHAAEWTQPVPEGPVLVVFWATWCGPCVAAIPMFNELYRQGVSVVALTEQNAETATRSKHGSLIEYPSGSSSDSLEDFRITGHGLPHYFLLDGSRQVVWYGQHVDSDAMLARFRALKTSQGPR
jgi:thiol-disulfide isomerase/thioredoxin